jgi:predicted RNase H-like HicB family nuclease
MDVTRHYTVIIEPDEEDGGFVARVPALPGVVDQGETEDEAMENIKEALEFTVTTMIEMDEEVPPSDAQRRTVRRVDLAV